jgi:CHAT domain-containing protein
MAEAHASLGEPQKSMDLLQEGMALAEKSANGAGYEKMLSRLGENQEALGRFNDALESQTRALALIHQKGGSPNDEWQFESRMAHILRAMGRKEEAREHYQSAIREIESLRSGALNTDEGRAGILSASRATYAETADLLYDLEREEEALATAEQGRARAFLDMLAESRVGVTDELSPEERKREDVILARISAAQKQLWKDNSTDEKRRLESELHSTEEALEALHLEVRRNNPRYASVQYPEPISVSEIRSKLLDGRTALLEYLLGEKRSLVWVVTKDKLTTAILPPRREIEDQVNAYRKLLSGRASVLTEHQSEEQINRVGAKLYRSLFQSIALALMSCRTLIIVPDGSLNYLPFEALVTSSKVQPTYLAEKFATVYGPSASVLVTVQTMNHEALAPPKALLAFGDPVAQSPAVVAKTNQVAELASQTRMVPAAEDYTERGFSFARLPYTRDEVLAISKQFPANQRRIYFGGAAREETVKSEKLDEFRYIHFATHGFLDETKPGRSGILLSRVPQSSEDGVLQMGEIMRLKMNADLVTLSACSTGLGKLVNGEGILGITRTFFYAGARNVAVTLWNVNDSATATLMASFYGYLNRGMAKSEALRQAKLSLLHGPELLWHHPYFWASFVIEGEGR